MTWSANFTGHYQRKDGTWDAELEKKIADLFRPVIDELKEYGLNIAVFNGNHYREDYTFKGNHHHKNYTAPKEA